jgi:hypothetical protein
MITIQSKLELILKDINEYYTNNGLTSNYTKNSNNTNYTSNDDSLPNLKEDLYNKLLNACFANPLILESTDYIDEIFDTLEDVEKDSTNFKGTDVKKIFEDYTDLGGVVEFFENSNSSDSFNIIAAFKETYKHQVKPFYDCITLYSDDHTTILQKLNKHSIESIYTLCRQCNNNRDRKYWCNPYTLTDEDVTVVKTEFNTLTNMKTFIDSTLAASTTAASTSAAMKRFTELVHLNSSNTEKYNEPISLSASGTITTYPITIDTLLITLSDYAFSRAKTNNLYKPLYEKKTSGGNKTHKLRIKNKNKTKSLRHKTRNTINRL